MAMAALALRMFAFGLQLLSQRGGDRPNPVDRWRHLELRGRPLDQVVKDFCAPESPAGRFNWAAERLFVDGENDLTAEVSHLLARAFAVADTPVGKDIAPALRRYADSLATSTDLRASLTLAVVDANLQCHDRLSVSMGGLMLAGDMHRVRDPAAEPADVVNTLVLHATTRAMDARIGQLLGQPNEPSAELLLASYRAVQEAMVARGLAVSEVFPEGLFTATDVWRHKTKVVEFAQAIADAASRPAGPGQQASTGIVELLREHGGTAAEEILSARLAHLTQPLRDELDLKLEEANNLPTGTYRETVDALQRNYNERLPTIRAGAIAGALAGDVTAWARPTEVASTSGSASGPEPAPSHGRTEAEAEFPDQYDPIKGKRKVD
jgi:hypothetical protein